MIGQPKSHRWRPVLIATHAISTRQPQGPMGSMKVVIEELQAHQCIPGVIAFGEGVRLAREGIEPITQGAVEPFHMHRTSWLHAGSQGGTDFDGQQSSMLIAMLDRLRQADRLWDDPRRLPPFAGRHPLAIGSLEDARVALPARAPPMQLAPVSPLDGS